MSAPDPSVPTEVSVRQFVNDSGAVTRGLREGRRYVLTINGEPLAEVTPIRRKRFVPTSEVQAMFATAPVLDYDELRRDLDSMIDDELSDDPLEGTGL
jgi:antitoxin (DNA-binding transcriptional repressor) of toxin-antitoxin stability system